MLACFCWQILDVNNQNFEKISHNRALDILRGSTHLSIIVKSNAVGEVIGSTHVSIIVLRNAVGKLVGSMNRFLLRLAVRKWEKA